LESPWGEEVFFNKLLTVRNLKIFIKKHQKIILGYVFVAVFVLLWTRLDWVVHVDSYLLPSGFNPTYEWLMSYWTPYFLQYYVLTFFSF
jgi:hypothetical protein